MTSLSVKSSVFLSLSYISMVFLSLFLLCFWLIESFMYLFICHEVMQHFRVFQSKFFWITCLYIIWYGRESYSMWTILKVFRMSYLYFRNIHLCVDLHSYSYLTPYRRPVFTSSFPLTSCRDLSQFCTQIAHKLPPKSPGSALVCNPMTEAAPVEFFYSTPRNWSEFSSEIRYTNRNLLETSYL